MGCDRRAILGGVQGGTKTTMKALVTGAAGFIGSHVAASLIREGIDVVALDDLSGGIRDNVPLHAKWVEGSVTNYDFLKRLLKAEQFDYVYHLAAYAAEGLSHFIRRYNYETTHARFGQPDKLECQL